ncbi:hypothetical protein [Brevibacillus nitrificans]|uniref:hypothetical protein n=1 Tax=Brevibacillus nitrificans TaxID=651560 RepID=UPI001FEAF5E8|nr:hypothetical protein [Brevibacillus nitrificans]
MFSKAKMGMLLGTMAAVLSIGSFGSAFAADETQTQTQTQTQNLNKPADVKFGDKMGHHRIGFGASFKENTELLSLLNLDADKLSEELKAGKTLAQIAEAQGVDEDDVVALLVKQQQEKLAEAVKAGKLTQEQADKMNENAADRVKAQLENTQQDKGRGFGFGGYDKNEELLSLLKLDAAKLSEELKAGKTLAAIAEAQGVDEDDVIALLVKQHEDKLAEAVKAGKLTQEQADKQSENTADRVKEQIEKTHQERGFGKGFGFGGYDKNEELLSLLKLDADKLSEQLKADKSLAAVAEAQGVAVDDVVALLVKQQEEKVAEAVKAGKLTQEKADQLSEKASEQVKAMVESTHQDRGHGKGMGFGFGKNEDLLALLKLDETKLAEELKAGKSLAEVAQAQGVSEDEVVALLVKQQKEKLAQEVEAGKLTQENADKRSEELEAFAKKMVESKHQPKAEKKAAE